MKSDRLEAPAKSGISMIETWLSTLSPGAQFVARTAIALNVNLVEAKPLVGGCYHLAFFLFEYLRSIAGIDVVPIVGWVNDGRDDFMISHAWIEFEGKVTDVSLTKTEYPEEQLSGALAYMGTRSDRDKFNIHIIKRVLRTRYLHYAASIRSKLQSSKRFTRRWSRFPSVRRKSEVA